MVVGEDAFQSGEGRSQTNIGLAGLQHELIEEVYKVNKNIVLVVMNGRPLDLSWYAERIPSILITWHLGSEAGNAIADVIFGDYNPSGKLPVSFPHTVGQEPLYYNQKNTGRPSNPTEVTYSHYNDAPKTALYPFGFGLSYTSYVYHDLQVEKLDQAVQVRVKVTNTGPRDGEEIVQVYVGLENSLIERQKKLLKGFEKVFIPAGATAEVTIAIPVAELCYYEAAQKQWRLEPGIYQIMVGPSSDERTLLKTTIELTPEA